MPTPNSMGHTIAIRDLNLGSKEWARVFFTFPPGEKKMKTGQRRDLTYQVLYKAVRTRRIRSAGGFVT